VTAASAADASNPGADGYFIFDNDGADAGTVSWDATGGSGADATPLLVLQPGASIQATDFLVV
jgi:hypothetical protein